MAEAGVVLTGAGLAVFTVCQTSFFPLFTHAKDAVLVFATAPSLVHGLPALAALFAAEKAMGTERIPIAATELTKSSAVFLVDLLIEKRYPLPRASTSKNPYLYCYEID